MFSSRTSRAQQVPPVQEDYDRDSHIHNEDDEKEKKEFDTLEFAVETNPSCKNTNQTENSNEGNHNSRRSIDRCMKISIIDTTDQEKKVYEIEKACQKKTVSPETGVNTIIVEGEKKNAKRIESAIKADSEKGNISDLDESDDNKNNEERTGTLDKSIQISNSRPSVNSNKDKEESNTDFDKSTNDDEKRNQSNGRAEENITGLDLTNLTIDGIVSHMGQLSFSIFAAIFDLFLRIYS